MEGEGVGEGKRTKGLRHGVSRPRKELKDPDQLYTTLKNLLAQIKVGRPGSPLGVPAPATVALQPLLGWVVLTAGLGHSGPDSSLAFLSSHTPVPGPSWSL